MDVYLDVQPLCKGVSMVARKSSKKLIHLWMDEIMVKRLDRLAKRHGLSRSELIRMTVLYFLEKGIKPEKGGE